MASRDRGKNFGKRDRLSFDEFEPQNVKIRVTTMIDEDVLDALKKAAQSKKTKYQTLLNQILRMFLMEGAAGRGTPLSEARVRQIVREELKRSS